MSSKSKRSNRTQSNQVSKTDNIDGVTILGQKVEYYKGNLPHPDILERLEVLHPGITQELMHLVKEQTMHRIDLESKAVQSNISNSKKGLNYGFTLALVLIVGSFYLIVSGNPIVGSIFGGSSILGLVYLFTRTNKIRAQELDEKKSRYMQTNK